MMTSVYANARRFIPHLRKVKKMVLRCYSVKYLDGVTTHSQRRSRSRVQDVAVDFLHFVIQSACVNFVACMKKNAGSEQLCVGV
jgi:hypothetical protein